MPHVVIECPDAIRVVGERFEPVMEETGRWRIKIENILVGKFHNRALLPTIVIEEGHTQTYYLLISINTRDLSLTVRLDPETDPVKTPGVKRSVALLAEKLMGWLKQERIIKHNLENYFLS